LSGLQFGQEMNASVAGAESGGCKKNHPGNPL